MSGKISKWKEISDKKQGVWNLRSGNKEEEKKEGNLNKETEEGKKRSFTPDNEFSYYNFDNKDVKYKKYLRLSTRQSKRSKRVNIYEQISKEIGKGERENNLRDVSQWGKYGDESCPDGMMISGGSFSQQQRAPGQIHHSHVVSGISNPYILSLNKGGGQRNAQKKNTSTAPNIIEFNSQQPIKGLGGMGGMGGVGGIKAGGVAPVYKNTPILKKGYKNNQSFSTFEGAESIYSATRMKNKSSGNIQQNENPAHHHSRGYSGEKARTKHLITEYNKLLNTNNISSTTTAGFKWAHSRHQSLGIGGGKNELRNLNTNTANINLLHPSNQHPSVQPFNAGRGEYGYSGREHREWGKDGGRSTFTGDSHHGKHRKGLSVGAAEREGEGVVGLQNPFPPPHAKGLGTHFAHPHPHSHSHARGHTRGHTNVDKEKEPTGSAGAAGAAGEVPEVPVPTTTEVIPNPTAPPPPPPVEREKQESENSNSRAMLNLQNNPNTNSANSENIDITNINHPIPDPKAQPLTPTALINQITPQKDDQVVENANVGSLTCNNMQRATAAFKPYKITTDVEQRIKELREVKITHKLVSNKGDKSVEDINLEKISTSPIQVNKSMNNITKSKRIGNISGNLNPKSSLPIGVGGVGMLPTNPVRMKLKKVFSRGAANSAGESLPLRVNPNIDDYRKKYTENSHNSQKYNENSHNSQELEDRPSVERNKDPTNIRIKYSNSNNGKNSLSNIEHPKVYTKMDVFNKRMPGGGGRMVNHRRSHSGVTNQPPRPKTHTSFYNINNKNIQNAPHAANGLSPLSIHNKSMCAEGACVTRYAVETQGGKASFNPGKVNQDTFLVKTRIHGEENTHLFAVADGHGLYGHYVSNFIKTQFPVILVDELGKKGANPIEALKESFERLNNDLHRSDIDSNFSGSTFTLILIKDQHVYSANVGDSRIILSSANRQNDHSSLKVCALTRDHKPSCKDEAKRVMREGGRIEPYKDPNTGEFIGPLRVWLKEQPVPGLAMTRSIGDDKGTSVGVDYRPGGRDSSAILQIKQYRGSSHSFGAGIVKKMEKERGYNR